MTAPTIRADMFVWHDKPDGPPAHDPGLDAICPVGHGPNMVEQIGPGDDRFQVLVVRKGFRNPSFASMTEDSPDEERLAPDVKTAPLRMPLCPDDADSEWETLMVPLNPVSGPREE